MNKNIPFRLVSDSFVVQGASRALIADTGRKEYHLIPKILGHILQTEKGNTIDEVIEKYATNDDEKEILIDYFSFLQEHELLLFSNQLALYSDIGLDWDFPGLIANSIIDFGLENIAYLPKIVSSLEDLGCRYVQLRFFENINITTLEQVITYFDNSIIEYVDVTIPYDGNTPNYYEKLVIENSRINSLVIFEYPNHQTYSKQNIQGRGGIFTYPNKITASSCGIVSPHFFGANIHLLTESQHHNTCLNRKVSIDQNGEIKNCPSMAESYGNIKDTTLQVALNHPDFKKYWNIKKDQIAVCQDCEFRHICTDCRAYLETPEDIYSKPLKCGYNPYTCEWQDWSTNPLKEKAMKYYNIEKY
ncbi:MAG: grasp-with-spasm system SPASM domain peptide maturase [Saprospiraceae bacterium]